MCGGGAERRAAKRARRDAKRARKQAKRREKQAIERAEQQAQQMLEQQQQAYETMQSMIPDPPAAPAYRPASTRVETSTTVAPTQNQRVKFGDEDGSDKLKKPRKRKRRGLSSLLIGLAPGVRGAGRGPNIS